MRRAVPGENDVVFSVAVGTAIRNRPYLLICDPFRTSGTDQHELIRPALQQKNNAVFVLKDQATPKYFSLILKDPVMNLVVIRDYLFEPGDNIRISVRARRRSGIFGVRFSGRGSAKYNCRNEFEEALQHLILSTATDHSGDVQGKVYYEYSDIAYLTIERYKPDLSAYAYHSLHADVLGRIGNYLYAELYLLFSDQFRNKTNQKGGKELLENFSESLNYSFINDIPDEVIANSKYYPSFLLRKLAVDVLMKYRHPDPARVFQLIRKIQSPLIRDRLIHEFLLQYGKIVVTDSHS